MLKIEQLDVKERSGRYLLKDISMEIPAGHVIGLTGKSGSGKTTLLRSILGMLHTSCHIDAGKILLDDIDLSHLSRKSHRELCGKKLGFIPQNPMTAFDSRLKIGYQMRETFVNRLHLNTSEATDLAKEKLVSVNLKDTDRILGAYPSELSGGMLQRVAAAILLGMSPDYVLADEPTAALDEENRDLLLLIMQEQMKDKGILFVSHDVAALKNLCQNVYVLGAGKIIEHGTMDKLLSSPQTDWMKQFSALSHRVNQVYHNVNQGDFNALSDINLHLCKGESLAIEGESGSGKSTLARLLIGIEKPTSGKILLDGEDITCWNYRTWKQHRKKIQAVFQDSSGTLNPARSAYANVEEALVNLTDKKRAERKKHILDLMDAVHMDYGLLETPVRQLSGGEQRRLSLLRAIAVEPDYLIMDEVTSGLDLISADAVLTLVENFVKLSGSSCIFITHSRKDAMRIANRIIIMREGRIAEQGYLIDQLSNQKGQG